MIKDRSIRFYRALATLIGTTIGVGIFGVPYAFAKAGFFVGMIYIVIIGFSLILVNLIYGEVCLRKKGRLRLVGQAGVFLSKFSKNITSIATVLSFWASLLAYIIVAGSFLDIIMESIWPGGTSVLYSLIFFTVFSVIIYRGLKFITKVELPMTVLLLIAMGLILFAAFQKIDFNNLIHSNLQQFFLPYGVVLFALGSASAIPEVEDILRNKRDLKKVIIIGGIVPLILTLIFAFAVVGVTGLDTSQDAISGLIGNLGSSVVLIGAIFGFLAITTSFLVIGENLFEVFIYDFSIKKIYAWAWALGVPLIIFLFATPGFINVIDIAGGIFGSFISIIITLMFFNSRKKNIGEPEYKIKHWKLWSYYLLTIFSLGLIYQIYFTFIGH